MTPHFHGDRAADAGGRSLLDRAILCNGHRVLVLHSLGLSGAAHRPQISLIHLRPSVQRLETVLSKSRSHRRNARYRKRRCGRKIVSVVGAGRPSLLHSVRRRRRMRVFRNRTVQHALRAGVRPAPSHRQRLLFNRRSCRRLITRGSSALEGVVRWYLEERSLRFRAHDVRQLECRFTKLRIGFLAHHVSLQFR